MKQKNSVMMCFKFLIVASLILTGCASGTRFSAAPPPEHGKARVYVYRKSNMIGSAGYDYVFVNDEPLGSVYSGNFATCEVPEGTTVFYVIPNAVGVYSSRNVEKVKDEKLHIDVESGKTYYVKLYVAFVGHEMKLVDEVTGAKDIVGLKLATNNEAK